MMFEFAVKAVIFIALTLFASALLVVAWTSAEVTAAGGLAITAMVFCIWGMLSALTLFLDD